ncbi:hypothetical protein E2C01_029526 [Portunus trituberculatus]|uniref:Uncharacterized protein n=1 Tax=Portunus trituberculatus TaxID=210409 RepID=A0A5B7ESG7_PORTR|nr:hypothetical protein [Portunus trituberculatus]
MQLLHQRNPFRLVSHVKFMLVARIWKKFTVAPSIFKEPPSSTYLKFGHHVSEVAITSTSSRNLESRETAQCVCVCVACLVRALTLHKDLMQLLCSLGNPHTK